VEKSTTMMMDEKIWNIMKKFSKKEKNARGKNTRVKGEADGKECNDVPHPKRKEHTLKSEERNGGEGGRGVLEKKKKPTRRGK